MKRSDDASQISRLLELAVICWLFVFRALRPHSIAVARGVVNRHRILAGQVSGLSEAKDVAHSGRSCATRILYSERCFRPWFLTNRWFQSASCAPPACSQSSTLFAENIPSRKIVRGLALTLIASCLINVFYTAVTRVVGRGVKLEGVKTRVR